MSAKKKETKLRKDNFAKDLSFTDKQKEFQMTIRNSTITMCQGAAGTSKTFSACYVALRLLAEGQYKRLVISKPIQEAGENLGFLPGDIKDKIGVYFESYFDNIEKIIGTENMRWMLDVEESIQMKPLAYMRGKTFDDAVVILDEAQNASIDQLMMIITRMGRNSKVILCGDVSQHDINSRMVALPTLGQLLDGVAHEEHCVSFFQFTSADVVRHPLLIELTERFEKWKFSEEGKASGLFK